ncbi:DUF3613 domain-containing protein [Ralstonia insidiosa]|jgi:hypothetical protein|uniref:Uncharacterized protein n=1 Tax=Ralstonia insidiosa TaxID=190721 RepID=A0A192A385_9RALS|nr:DUF3613 domain-containing protein [Ralstonia insidiosa]ANJ74808.1 hypothetical protein A9Y76_19780 [Ralstonia insidiosa]KAB0467306.1 DUF3613 domain-containing protein [Ralstonia insidiosa]MBY4909520.1 DUF3613 domain-containing protein [Ralstonia insidiosa]
MIQRLFSIACMAAWLASGMAVAQGFSGTSPQRAEPVESKVDGRVNEATRTLLKAQREGTYAGELVPLRGEEAALAYQRYLETFSRPMPGMSQAQSGGRSSTGNAAQSSAR